MLEDERWCEAGKKKCGAPVIKNTKGGGHEGKTRDSFSDEIFRLHVGWCGATTVGDGIVEGTERRGEVVAKQRVGEVETTTDYLVPVYST